MTTHLDVPIYEDALAARAYRAYAAHLPRQPIWENLDSATRAAYRAFTEIAMDASTQAAVKGEWVYNKLIPYLYESQARPILAKRVETAGGNAQLWQYAYPRPNQTRGAHLILSTTVAVKYKFTLDPVLMRVRELTVFPPHQTIPFDNRVRMLLERGETAGERLPVFDVLYWEILT